MLLICWKLCHQFGDQLMHDYVFFRKKSLSRGATGAYGDVPVSGYNPAEVWGSQRTGSRALWNSANEIFDDAAKFLYQADSALLMCLMWNKLLFLCIIWWIQHKNHSWWWVTKFLLSNDGKNHFKDYILTIISLFCTILFTLVVFHRVVHSWRITTPI